MNNIILGEEQLQAIDLIKKFISSNELYFSLSGYAGTGKSTIIKYMIEYLDDEYIQYILCAPTHKAKGVIRYFTQKDACTIHQLLALSPNLEIFELDFRQLLFHSNSKKLNMFPTCGIVIIDEASMINDDLFKLLCEKAKIYKSKLIFVGDPAQLKPVNSQYNSKVFDLESNFTLTKIYRQSINIGYSDVLEKLRTSSVTRFEEQVGEDGSLYSYTDIIELFKKAIPIFQTGVENKDIFETKFLAYTNNRVSALNNKIREILFPGDELYYNSEILTCYENLKYGIFELWNSMDYVIIDKPVKHDIIIPLFIKLPAYKLTLYDYASNSTIQVSILDKNIPQMYWDSLSNAIEELRLSAVEAKLRNNRSSSKLWRDYFSIIGSFASPINLYYDNRIIKKKTFDYGYAMTVHKS